MTDYAYAKNCRRQFVLRYFGDRDASGKCGNCDVCVGPRLLVSAPALDAPAASSQNGEHFSALAFEELRKWRRGLSQSLQIAPKAERQRHKETVILLSAQGQPFSQAVAQELASTERVVIVCGRYEGVDERVNELLCDREISIGDYVLSGGELAAAVIIDTVVRLLPGALGNPDSSRFESFGAEDMADDAISADGLPRSTYGAGGLLDYPHYTRPAEFMGVPIPEALAGGNHEVIRRWRRRMALKKTLENRPDLLKKIEISDEDREILAELRGYGDSGAIE